MLAKKNKTDMEIHIETKYILVTILNRCVDGRVYIPQQTVFWVRNYDREGHAQL